jgi:hypothetical protein
MAQKHGKDIQFVWWHSHAKMGAFWSGTDTKTMTEYSSGDWSMFLVVNVRGEYKFRVQIWQPIEAGEDIELEILNGPDSTIPKEITEEVNQRCSEEISRYTYGTWNKDRNKNQLKLHHMHYNAAQENIWAEKEEIKSYNASFGIQDEEDLAYDYISQKIDRLNDKLCKGEIKHNKYREGIKSMNQKLLKGTYDFKIKIPKNNAELDTFIQTHFPHDFIVDKHTEEPFDNDVYGGLYV